MNTGDWVISSLSRSKASVILYLKVWIPQYGKGYYKICMFSSSKPLQTFCSTLLESEKVLISPALGNQFFRFDQFSKDACAHENACRLQAEVRVESSFKNIIFIYILSFPHSLKKEVHKNQ